MRQVPDLCLRLRLSGVAAAFVLCTGGCDFDASRPESAPAAHTVEAIESRRVWRGVEGNFYAASPSPDGRLVTLVDWSTGDLAVRDLDSGQLRHVTSKGTWADNSDYAEYSVFSPDGQRIAYSWLREAAGYQLRVIDIDGSNDRVLVPHADGLDYVVAEDWSPDGGLILVTLSYDDRSTRLATVSAETGELNMLRSGDWHRPRVAAFSRDGQWIAFDARQGGDTEQRDIFIIAASGGGESRLVGGAATNTLLGWLPDGSGILYYSDRDGMRAIWKQAVSAGRAVGEPLLVKPDVWQLVPVGFSQDAYFYGVYVAMPQVYTATLDAESERVITPPARVQVATEEPTGYGAWSADGNYLAYLSIHLDRSEDLVIRSVNGADSRTVPLRLDNVSQIQWHPDGNTILAMATDAQGRRGVHAIDVQTGTSTALLLENEAPDASLSFYRLGPDGQSMLYFKRAVAGERGLAKTANVVRFDLTTGLEQVLDAFGIHGIAFPSPDGLWYAKQDWDPATSRHSLHVGRTDDPGSLRTIYETDRELLANRGGVPFMPDGAYVLIAERQSEGSALLRVPLDGGIPTTLLEWEGEILDLRLSPDGRRISFGSGSEVGELWMLELSDFNQAGGADPPS